MTHSEFNSRIASLTSIDAILIAQHSTRVLSQQANQQRDESLFDALAQHGLEEQYAELVDELLPKVEWSASIQVLPYPVRSAVSHAVSLGCAAITGQGVLPSDLTDACLEAFRNPKPTVDPSPAGFQFSV